MTTTRGTKIVAAVGGVLGVLANPMAVALAEPISGTGADVIVQHLQDEGYTVQFNMPSEMVLSRCTVSGINGLTVMMSDGNLMAMMAPPGSRGNVFVTLSCPDSNN